MKQITIRIDNDQFEKLQKISKDNRIKNVSWLIRRAIDMYLISQGKEMSL